MNQKTLFDDNNVYKNEIEHTKKENKGEGGERERDREKEERNMVRLYALTMKGHSNKKASTTTVAS